MGRVDIVKGCRVDAVELSRRIYDPFSHRANLFGLRTLSLRRIEWKQFFFLQRFHDLRAPTFPDSWVKHYYEIDCA